MTAHDRTLITPQKIILSLLCGIALTAGFPPMGWTVAPWIGFVFLFWAICDLDAKKSFYLGLAAGLAHYLSLLYWLEGTMKTYGYLPLWISVCILVLLAFYLSLYMAVFSFLAARVCRRPAWALVMLPAFWICLEYLRSVLFTGFPWGLIGYSQYDFLKLIQLSDIFGVYGVSFLVVFANCVIFFALLHGTRNKWQGHTVGVGPVVVSLAALICMIVSSIIYGNNRMASVDRMAEKSDKVEVSVIQGNIAQDEKWDMEFRIQTIDTYFRLSGQALKQGPDLIIWPETAAPFYFGYEVGLTERVLDGIRSMGNFFLIGAPTVDFEGEQAKYYNSAYLINPEGKVAGRYDKVHLVPFGEYVPLKKFLPFIHNLVAQVGDFNAGKIGNTLKWGDKQIGILICYEVIFPELASKLAQNNAGCLISITNDAWFGDTGAPYQHFYMAAFRAIETRRALARAANTGISGFIDPAGRIMEQTGLFTEAAATRKIPIIRNYQTVYTRYGNVLVWACLIASVFYIIILLKKEIFSSRKKLRRTT